MADQVGQENREVSSVAEEKVRKCDLRRGNLSALAADKHKMVKSRDKFGLPKWISATYELLRTMVPAGSGELHVPDERLMGLHFTVASFIFGSTFVIYNDHFVNIASISRAASRSPRIYPGFFPP